MFALKGYLFFDIVTTSGIALLPSINYLLQAVTEKWQRLMTPPKTQRMCDLFVVTQSAWPWDVHSVFWIVKSYKALYPGLPSRSQFREAKFVLYDVIHCSNRHSNNSAITLFLMREYQESVHWHVQYALQCHRTSAVHSWIYRAHSTCMGSLSGYHVTISWLCFCHTCFTIYSTYTPVAIHWCNTFSCQDFDHRTLF